MDDSLKQIIEKEEDKSFDTAFNKPNTISPIKQR